MDHFKSNPRRCFFRWIGWFFLINALLAGLVIFSYLPIFSTLKLVPHATDGSTIFGWFYFVVAFFAEVSLYMFICGAICAVVAIIFPWRWLNIGLAGTLGAVMLGGLIVEAITFRLFHMHYGMVGWQAFKAGALSEVVPLGLKETMAITIGMGIAIAVEITFAWWLWRIFARRKSRANKFIFGSLAVLWVFVYATFGMAVAGYLWPQAYRYTILRVGRSVPYLSQLYMGLFEPNQSIRPMVVNKAKIPLVIQEIEKPLSYPKQPLHFSPTEKKMNVLIIGVDTWRFSSLTSKIMPITNQFAQQSIQFVNHYSGGNCTQPGLFSLFYGLPANYWQSFLDSNTSPVLMDAVLQQKYRVGIFLSAPVNFPSFDKTIFVDLKSLKKRTKGSSSMDRDKRITQEFISFINKKLKQPFFSFLFYDALHNYCESARPLQNPFQPAIESCNRLSLDASSPVLPYLNLYRNKAGFIDRQIGELLKALRKKHLMQNTIIIVTADHGEQINDEGMGIWGHASAYTKYQLHVPMLVYWPGMKPKKVSYETTHYDIVPTLMTKVLGCKNERPDYTVGYSLFTEKELPYFIAGSYGDYAIISSQNVLRVYPNGDYNVLDWRGNVQKQAKIPTKVLEDVFVTLQAYFTH